MFTPIRWQQRFQNFEKAYLSLDEALSRHKSDPKDRVVRAGCIQNYEFTIELAWKTLKDLLFEKGIALNNPSDVIREAYRQKYLDHADVWLEALKGRNLTSHAYDEKMAEAILKQINESYFPLLTHLYAFLKTQSQ